MQKTYFYEPGDNDGWEVYGRGSDGEPEWLATVETEFLAEALIARLTSEPIYVAMVHHRHGTNTYAGYTYNSAQDQLYDYVCGEWEAEIGDEPLPDDPEVAIERYFARITDEDHEIVAVTPNG